MRAEFYIEQKTDNANLGPASRAVAAASDGSTVADVLPRIALPELHGRWRRHAGLRPITRNAPGCKASLEADLRSTRLLAVAG